MTDWETTQDALSASGHKGDIALVKAVALCSIAKSLEVLADHIVRLNSAKISERTTP